MWRWVRQLWQRRKARSLKARLLRVSREAKTAWREGSEQREAESSELERTAASAAYECRITLFLDFLGFGELVGRSISDPSIIGEVLRAVRRAAFLIDSEGASESEMVTQFSDSLVVSIRADEESGVFWTLDRIGMIVVELAERGFLVRGGLTVGPLHHTNELVMGPAMNRAYKLESKKAQRPRVIVDRSVLRAARSAHGPQHSADKEVECVRSLLLKDADHRLYIDYVSCNAFDNLGYRRSDYPSYLRKLTDLVADGLAHSDDSVRRKYEWLNDRLTAEMNKITTIGAMPDRRAVSPLFYDNIDQVAADYQTKLTNIRTFKRSP